MTTDEMDTMRSGVAIVRTLPGLVDHNTTPTGQIPVTQIVDHDHADYDVRLDVSGHVDLIALAKAIFDDTALMFEWNVLMHNRRHSAARRVMAAAELRNSPAVRAALTIRLDPAEAGLAADSLAERLEQAALEPGRCEWSEGDCNRFSTGDDVLCPKHVAQLANEETSGEWSADSYYGTGL